MEKRLILVQGAVNHWDKSKNKEPEAAGPITSVSFCKHKYDHYSTGQRCLFF